MRYISVVMFDVTETNCSVYSVYWKKWFSYSTF